MHFAHHVGQFGFAGAIAFLGNDHEDATAGRAATVEEAQAFHHAIKDCRVMAIHFDAEQGTGDGVGIGREFEAAFDVSAEGDDGGFTSIARK